MDVSVIIVNYNTCILTRNCLQSIFEQSKDIDFEVIVSDNGSTDGSIEMIKNEFPQVFLIENNANLGFGKANNVGYKYAKGKYIFLLNSDTILLNNAIKIFFDVMQILPSNIACVGCSLVNKQGDLIHSYGNYPTFWNELLRRPFAFLKKFVKINQGFDTSPYIPINNECFIVEYVTGADLFIRKNVIEQCGLFDEDFFMYYEETEMQYRYRQNGYFSCITTKPQIQHLVGGSNKSNRKMGKDLKSMLLCYEKIYGKSRCMLFKIFLFCISLPIVALDFRFPLNNRVKYLKNILITE